MWPVQPGCPHEQEISILLAIPSQWALQYLEPSEAGQLQAAFAHFLEFAIGFLLYRSGGTGKCRLRRSMREGRGRVVRACSITELILSKVYVTIGR